MKKRAVSIILLLTTALMGGCWDAHSIEDMDICTAVVVDYQDGAYTFYAEIVDISPAKNGNGGGEQGKSSTVVKGTGESFAEARMNIDRATYKPIYLGAVQSLVITEAMADNDIEEYAYRVRELPAYRKTVDMIITQDTPMDVLSTKPGDSVVVGFAIENTLRGMVERGAAFHMSLSDVLQKLSAQNKAYLLPTIGVKNEQVVLTGYAVFDRGRRKGFIPYEEARGIVYISLGGEKKTPTFLYVAKTEQAEYTLETSLVNSDVLAKREDSKAFFIVDLKFSAKLLYPSVNIPVTQEVEERIKAELYKSLMEDVTRAIHTSLDYGCDFLNFSEPFRIRYPGVYEQLDWNSTFSGAEFSINLDIEIKDNEAYDYGSG